MRPPVRPLSRPPSRTVSQARLAATSLALAWSAASAQPADPAATGQAAATASYAIVGDAIPEPLGESPGDVARGHAIVADRAVGLCLLCHSGPFPDPHLQGNIAPDLRGAGSRWSEGQLRLRLVDGRRLNPQSVMPAYHRAQGYERVASAWRGKPLLSAQQIEDVVAYLRGLRSAPDGSRDSRDRD